MLLKRNLLENVTIVSSCGTLICVLLNYVTDISLINGVWFPLYILALFILSVLFSFKCMQWLLRLNKPIKYELEDFVKQHPYLSFLKKCLPQPNTQVENVWKEYDTNELSVISTVLERKLVSSWYVTCISQEIGFPFACKQMLDQMIGKAFQICNKIETKDVFVDLCAILITHLKEYERAVKRQTQSPSVSIESLYKKLHPISEANTKYTTTDHCANILRILLKELLPWELWDTPHSELLVRILSKKLDMYMSNTLADPAWLNDKLMTYLTGEEYSEPYETEEVVNHVKTETDKQENIERKDQPPPMKVPVVKSDTETKQHTNVHEDVVRKMENIQEEQAVDATPPVDIRASPVLRQKRGRQGRNEVKIYDRVIEGSVKTWESDVDLQCISLGQDLLASLDGEITLSRLWGHEEPDGSPDPQPLWFGEEDSLDLDIPECRERDSPKAADALLKDLQTTVSQAKTKIGDLQDEAAGMMEGLLDFGIAGLRKGLRFTGLGDDAQEKSPSHQKERNAERSSPEHRQKLPLEHGTPVVQREENSNGNVPHLVKQHRVTSQDSMPGGSGQVGAGPGQWVVGGSDSPEPQYEEAADLSSSIAKLRCLLSQREAMPSARGEDGGVWWEHAEETRGRTQQQRCSRPVDAATLADEYDMSLERNASPNHTSNNMQRLDKLFQRTVTGVFNSLKTAVGGEEDPSPAAPAAPRAAHLNDWTYVCTERELSVVGGAARLAASRRALAHVDAALDSLRLPPARRACAPSPPPPLDLEEWCSSQGRAWSAARDAAAAAGLARSHVAHRLATILLAEAAESIITEWLASLTAWLRRQIFAAFEQADGHSGTPTPPKRPVDLDLTCAALRARLPALQALFGSEGVTSSLRFSLGSLAHAPVARDVACRAGDLLAAHFKRAAGQGGASFDNN